MQKVIVIGCPGSGKTTFAQKLSQKTGLPLHSLDAVWHKPDRSHLAREEFDTILHRLLQSPAWILDGHYSRTLPLRLQSCDTVFFFDLPTELCLQGARARLGRKREDLPWVGTALSPDLEQSIRSFRTQHREGLFELLHTHGEAKQITVFRTREEADAFLAALDEKNA